MSRQRSISFHTLGCKLNFAETSSIQKTFEKAGYMILPFGEGSDISVINTCSVTEFADRKCRSAIKKAKSNAPEGKVVMIGCYAQLKPKEISELEGVDMVLGAKEKFNLLEHISELDLVGASAIVKSGLIDEVNDFESSYSFGNRTRSFLKVQDGCNYKCSFCNLVVTPQYWCPGLLHSCIQELNINQNVLGYHFSRGTLNRILCFHPSVRPTIL